MPDWHFEVNTKDELDLKIRTEILALESIGRGNEIYGTVHVTSTDESVMQASLVPHLEARSVSVEWTKK